MTTSMHRVRIVDGEKLRSVLERLRKREGSDGNAASQLRIEKYTFTKLRTGNVSQSMSYETYAAILNVLGGQAAEWWLEPDPILFFASEPSDREVKAERQRTGKSAKKARAELWAEAQERAKEDANLFEDFRDSVMGDDGDFVRGHYENWLDAELQRLEPQAKKLWAVVGRDDACIHALNAFFKRVKRIQTTALSRPTERDATDVVPPTMSDRRVRLAVFRALEPLYGAELTWGVERSVHELRDAGELGTFLKAALKCEEILLKRERDLKRFATAVPPMSYGQWLGSFDVDE